MRKRKRTVFIGSVPIGGANPIVVQSMTKNPPSRLNEAISEINRLAQVGCELIRVAVPTLKDAYFLSELKEKSVLPVVADIHFDSRIAIKAIENGADEIRINPGNFPKKHLAEIVKAAKARKKPIRIGVNSGSLEKTLEYSAQSLVDSALKWARLIENLGFRDLKISAKSSDAAMTVQTYRILDKACDYPLHIGVTESGTVATGAARSAIALGKLLEEGIGDTIRVSLTGNRVDEIDVCYEILRTTGTRNIGAKLISCPSCGRVQIDLTKLANDVQSIIRRIRKPITVSVMGCVVNAIGEAKNADIAIAGGVGHGLIIKKGKIVENVKEEKLLGKFEEELEKMGAL